MTILHDEYERLNLILLDLNLPKGQWVINGSGVLALHGIERNRSMGDLDIFCTTSLWFELLNRNEWNWVIQIPDPGDSKRRCDPPILRSEIRGLTVDVYHSWRRRGGAGDFNPAFYILNAEEVSGWPCAPLQFIMDWKLAMGRNKDLQDVIAIRNHLGIEIQEV